MTDLNPDPLTLDPSLTRSVHAPGLLVAPEARGGVEGVVTVHPQRASLRANNAHPIKHGQAVALVGVK